MENPTAPSAAPEATWLGRFVGSQLDHDHCELLAIQHISHKLLRAESELFGLKWFDYRHIHATKATYYFAHLYNEAHKRMIGIAKDIEAAPYFRALKGTDFLEGREKLSLWKLRQAIDTLGMRYEFFWFEAVNWYVNAGWQQPPRPQHLLHNEEMLKAVMERWEEYCGVSLELPKDPFYRVKNFVGHRDQLAFEDWILRRVMRRPQPKYALRTIIYDRDMLRVEELMRQVSTGLVETVIDLASTVSHD